MHTAVVSAAASQCCPELVRDLMRELRPGALPAEAVAALADRAGRRG